MNLFVFYCSIKEEANAEFDEKLGSRTIEILNPEHLADQIAMQLHVKLLKEEVVEINGEADCISRAHRAVTYQDKPPVAPESVIDSRYNVEQVFTKDAGDYEDEAEYRIIWFPSQRTAQKIYTLPMKLQYLDIEVPEIWEIVSEVA